jgi:3-hydroxybutyryl-CoA dehydratase
MLLGGLISGVLGNKLPGPGTIYLSQHFDFLAPVRIGDTITATVEISEVMMAEKKVRVKTTCVNQEGIRVLDGEAVVSPPKAPKS